MDERTEVIVVNGIAKIQQFADVMRAFYPETDRDYNPKAAVDTLRKCGEIVRDLADKILLELDL